MALILRGLRIRHFKCYSLLELGICATGPLLSAVRFGFSVRRGLLGLLGTWGRRGVA